MKTTFILLPLAAPIFWTTLVFAQAPTAPKPASTKTATTTKAANASQADEGGRKFDANCGRCHTAPEQLSPSLTGTVVRHMRVRASLTAQDEKDILRYLAP